MSQQDMRFDMNARVEVWVTADAIRWHADYNAAIALADEAARIAALRLIACDIARNKIAANSNGDFAVTADVGLDAVNIDRINWNDLTKPKEE